MNKYYTKEKNTLIILALFKQYGIKRVVASPGTTNIAVVGSMQNDPYFEMYSAADERSAAYIACGLAAETGEPVVLTCTGATASRNYMPGLTEAFYRKLPIIALTSALNTCRSGHLFPQFVDRTKQPIDLVKLSVQIPIISKPEDEWECITKINNALLETKRHGGGPVHINLLINGEFFDFSEKTLPCIRKIDRYFPYTSMPPLPSGKIAVFIGSHKNFTENETRVIDEFCEKYNGVVFCDHTSGYYGNYAVHYALVCSQMIDDTNVSPDLLIHIGEISGDYYSTPKLQKAKNVWRVSEDGEIRDYFRKLTVVFEMSEEYFFSYYAKLENVSKNVEYYKSCVNKYNYIVKSIDDMPFSNIWIAKQTASRIPMGSTIHLGILNSLRAWNFFHLPKNVHSYCNVGGFGIDGILSSLIGASLVNKDKLYFGIIGDLAFFYDINSLANRHVGKNLRIMLINNGKGTEFRNYTHPGSRFGEDADKFIAAGGHYGNKSNFLIKHYAEDLGFEYISASNKQDYLSVLEKFTSAELGTKSIIFEVFTNSQDESDALRIVNNLSVDKKILIKSTLLKTARSVIGNGIAKDMLKYVLNKK